jgi:hypothetical protein
MGVLTTRLPLAAIALAAVCSCASPRPATTDYATAARGACGDAQLVKKELVAMRTRHVTRPHAVRVLTAAANRIDERAQAAGSGAWRLRDLAASLRVMSDTIAARGDEGVASRDARVTRAEVGCG